MELILIVAIVGLAGVYCVRSVVNALRPRPAATSCGCGCNGCSGSIGDTAGTDPCRDCNLPVTSE